MVTILITEAIILFNIVLPLFFIPLPDANHDMGGAIIQALTTLAAHWIIIVISLILAVLQFMHQITLLVSAHEPQNLSILALGINVPMLLLLAVMQALRVKMRQPVQNIIYLRGWFLETGNVPVNYIVTALGEMILLGMCLRLVKRRVVLE